MNNKWLKPKEVNNVDLAFGPSNMNEYLPAYDEIPKEFKNEDTKWNKIFNTMFFRGCSKDSSFDCKDGINGETAIKHIYAIMRSFNPKHEHKEAGVAYLMSLWFNNINIVPSK
jgi:hypothetical protein